MKKYPITAIVATALITGVAVYAIRWTAPTEEAPPTKAQDRAEGSPYDVAPLAQSTNCMVYDRKNRTTVVYKTEAAYGKPLCKEK